MALQKGRVRPDGEQIRRLREQRGWTQEELARRAGIQSVKTISRVESCVPCFAAKLKDVAIALEVPVSSLMLQTFDEPVHVELAVERATKRTNPRSVVVQAECPRFGVGDHLSFGCRIDRGEHHLWLVNIGVSGREATLIPNRFSSGGPLRANEWNFFPDHDSYSFPIQGPPGIEAVIAFATTKAVRQAGSDVQASTLTIGDEVPMNATGVAPAYVLGMTTIEFEVTQ
jgi:hypothetical protein